MNFRSRSGNFSGRIPERVAIAVSR